MEYESVIRAVSQQSEDVEKRAKWLTDRCLQDPLDGKNFRLTRRGTYRKKFTLADNVFVLEYDDVMCATSLQPKYVHQRTEWMRKRFLEDRDHASLFPKGRILTEFVAFRFLNEAREAIPSLIDGLTAGQRKILHTCMKRNEKNEVKVAQLDELSYGP